MNNNEYVGRTRYLSGTGTIAEAYWRTLCMDMQYTGKEADEEKWLLDRTDYERANRCYATKFVKAIDRLYYKAEEVSDEGISAEGISAEEISDMDTVISNVAIETTTADRSFFITRKGYMGLGPPHLTVGDDVAVLAGGNTPFILRKTSEKIIEDYGARQCHMLVGDCYMHGLYGRRSFRKCCDIGGPSTDYPGVTTRK